MMLYSFLWTSALLAREALAVGPLTVRSTPPADANHTVHESFVSLAIEFSSFPDFAGNSTHPNHFSYNLIKNLGAIQGTNPVVRVGGNTQDYALFNSSQPQALVGSFDLSKSKDYPTTITIGPAFFDSYSTWPNTTFIHGFNMGKNGSIGRASLLATVPWACKALANGKLHLWEFGNEPDLFTTSAQGPVRPSDWDEYDYASEWLDGTRAIRKAMAKVCPRLAMTQHYKYSAPNFGGTTNSLAPVKTWQSGLNNDSNIAEIDGHLYIGGATQPGVTLQGTLMNHTKTVSSVDKQLANWTMVQSLTKPRLPFIFGETNSLYNEGAPGLSNTFGAALWGLDFNLYCASRGVSRVHMQQGTNSRYAAWQPVVGKESKGTKAPYYGSVAVARMVGDLTKANVTIVNIPLADPYNVAYAAYADGALRRIAAIQMTEFNYTGPASLAARPAETFSFALPPSYSTTTVSVHRLMANGSDSITGVTFDGVSYNYELNLGQPVVMKNVTVGQTVAVQSNGMLNVEVPWSSAVILNLA